jgi:hypothetical protein
VYWGDMKQADIQYPVLKTNLISEFSLENRVYVNRFDLGGNLKHPSHSWVFPIHAAQIPTGNILLMGGTAFDPNPWAEDLKHQTAIFSVFAWKEAKRREIDIASMPFILNIDNPGFDIFCSGHSTLPDGNLLVVGGTQEYANDNHFHEKANHYFSGLRHVSVYNWYKGNWIRCPDMMHGRWYPSTVVMNTGNVLVMDGHVEKENESEHYNTDLEIFQSTSYTWRTQERRNLASTAGSGDEGYYPRLFLLADGSIFSASALGTVPNQPDMINKTCRYDSKSRRWILVNNTALVNGHSYTAVMFPINSSIGDDQTIMVFGTVNPHICKPLKSGSEAEWQLANYNRANGLRIHVNSVLLPDGRIAFIGGIKKYTGYKTLNEDGVLEVEIFDPYSKQWSTHMKLKNVRNYHFFAILMSTGDILIGGSNTDVNSGSAYRDLSFEIYTPPYSNTTKIIFTVDKSKSYYNNISITVNEEHIGLIRKFTLIRQYSVTHGFAYDQRLYDVFEFSQENGTVILHLSENKSLLPPGYYMLFAISIYNSVSEGEIIHIL